MEGSIWRHNRFLSLAKNLINGKLIFQNIISSRIDVITDRLTESLLNGCKWVLCQFHLPFIHGGAWYKLDAN